MGFPDRTSQKSDGSTRTCKDYKVSINKIAKREKFSVPKTMDLLATLNGGNRLSKLDLSYVYQQLLLQEDSKEFLRVNTHKIFSGQIGYSMGYIRQRGFSKEKLKVGYCLQLFEWTMY